MGADFNKNEKQSKFNTIKGVVTEINIGDKFSNITLEVGHENKRPVNLVVKKDFYDTTIKDIKLKDKVSVRYYLTSKNKEGRWNTMANIITVEKENV